MKLMDNNLPTTEENELLNSEPPKKRRGRPKGSKNKPKGDGGYILPHACCHCHKNDMLTIYPHQPTQPRISTQTVRVSGRLFKSVMWVNKLCGHCGGITTFRVYSDEITGEI